MREITVLDARRQVAPGDASGAEIITVQAAFWFPVPAGSENPLKPEDVVTRVTDATQEELDALTAGQVIEEVSIQNFPGSSTLATMKSGLVTAYNDRATQLQNKLNPGKFTGSIFDGSSWTRP